MKWCKVSLVVLALGLTAACADDEDPGESQEPDTGVEEDVTGDDISDDVGDDDGDAGTSPDADEGDEDADAGDDTGPDDVVEVDEDCTLELVLSTGLIVAESWETPLSAGQLPRICWEVPQDATLPDPGAGWKIRVERSENAGSENFAWRVRGYAPEFLEIGYGECPDGVQECTEAHDLAPGSYFVHVFDDGDPTGLAGSLVVEVQ